MVPKELKYNRTHEYARLGEDGRTATVGITQFAAEQLGDIVYLELPPPGTAVTRDTPFGVIESVKAAVDLNAPVSGEVVETNTSLPDDLDRIAADPYGQAWMIKIGLSDPAELDALLDANQYEQFLQTEQTDP